MIGTEESSQPRPIESLSEQDLRAEIVQRINTVLKDLPEGPVADGGATNGYKRGEQNLPSLRPDYFQFSKALDEKQQVGVQIALFGLYTFMSIGSYKAQIKRALEKEDMSSKEREELDGAIKRLRETEEGVARDGIAPDSNRYYFIPSDPIQPATVSVESFISRAHRVTPAGAEKVLLSETIQEAKNVEAMPMDKESGQPRSKIAGLQDLRDALAIVRGGDRFVEEIIAETPKRNWGRPGITD